METQVKDDLIRSDQRMMNGTDVPDATIMAKLRTIRPVKFREEIDSNTSETTLSLAEFRRVEHEK